MDLVNLKHERDTFNVWLTLSDMFDTSVVVLKSLLDYKYPKVREVSGSLRPKL